MNKKNYEYSFDLTDFKTKEDFIKFLEEADLTEHYHTIVEEHNKITNNLYLVYFSLEMIILL